MKVDVKYACGHLEVRQVYGSWKERERLIAYLSRQVCPECRHKQEMQEAKKLEAEFSLPEFEIGSEKQKAWATSIRAEWVKRMLESAERFADKAGVVREALIEAASTKKSAVWWVENRGNLNGALAPAYEEALRKRGITQ